MPRTGLTAEQLKDKAIQCTLERMRIQGFEKVRLSDIAKDLGLSHAALYGHFADKSALLDAVTERWLNELDCAQQKLISENDLSDPLKCIEKWFLNLHRIKRETVLADPELFRAFNLASLERPFVQKHLKAMRDQLFGLVQAAIEAKQIKRKDPESLVELLLEATSAYYLPALVLIHINEEREPSLSNLLSIIFKGLC